MAMDEVSEARTLDPVVVEALNSLTWWVYRRRGPRLQDKLRPHHSMLERESRDYALAVFKHLRHGGFEFSPFLVRRWAVAHDGEKADAQLLDDYAAGVLAGVQYHHADPRGRHAIITWQNDAKGKMPWQDPGRPARGRRLQ
jgi:hypothetical protein